MIEYTPIIVTFAMLALVGSDVVRDARKGVWRGFEISLIVFTLAALVWWTYVKIEGFL